MILSIIILSWNTKKLTKQCLKSIFDNVKDIAFEVIVVDNGSHDGSAEMVAQEFPQVILIRNSENLGFTKGNNQGFKASRREYVLFLNSDTIIPRPDLKCVIPAQAGIQSDEALTQNKILDPRFRGDDKKENGDDNVIGAKSQLRKMVEAIQTDKKIGALTPKLVYPDGRFQEEFYRKFPSFAQTIWLYIPPFNRLAVKSSYIKRKYLTSIDPLRSSYVDDMNLPGSVLLMPAKVFEEVGMWPEDYFFWLEDVDLNLRIKKAGYKLYYFSGAEIIHFGGASWAKWVSFQKFYNFRSSYLHYFRKHKGGFQAFLVKWVFILNAIILILPIFFVGLFIRKYRGKAKVFSQFAWKFLSA